MDRVLDGAEEQKEFINLKIEQVKDGQLKLTDKMKLFEDKLKIVEALEALE